jgi:DNA-binding transcriptional MerR regulator
VKLLKIGDLAKRTGKTHRTIHYYEELKLLSPARRTHGGFRLYGPGDVERIELIERLQELGFTLDQIGAVIQVWHSHDARDREKLRRHLDEGVRTARKKIARMEDLVGRLERSLLLLSVHEDCREARPCEDCECHRSFLR